MVEYSVVGYEREVIGSSNPFPALPDYICTNEEMKSRIILEHGYDPTYTILRSIPAYDETRYTGKSLLITSFKNSKRILNNG